jgi:hypothetical protein
MAWIYQADLFCDLCGPAIVKDLITRALKGEPTGRTGAQGNPLYGIKGGEPGHWFNVEAVGGSCGLRLTLEWRDHDYDSDDMPKPAGTDDDHEATDTPQHCANGDTCEGRICLDNGDHVGAPIGSALTSDGVAYLRETFQATRGKPSSDRAVALHKHWSDRFDGYDLPCYHCGRDQVAVTVQQSGDAITPEGEYVAHGTPGAEGQCVVSTPCESCADRDRTCEGSSWESVGNGECYVVLHGEAETVAERLKDAGYDVLSWEG